MGQKVHPEGLRVGYIHDWKSTWFNEKDFSDYLLEDIHIRDHIENKLAHAGLGAALLRLQALETGEGAWVHAEKLVPGVSMGSRGFPVAAAFLKDGEPAASTVKPDQVAQITSAA